MGTLTPPQLTPFFLLLLLHGAAAWSIGVNYGTKGNDLPPPSQVAEFLKTKTNIDRIKLFEPNDDVMKAFANTGISVTITAVNGDIPGLTGLPFAKQWVATHVTPFVPATKIIRVLVGNEVLHWGPQDLRDSLVTAMRTMHQALQLAGHKDIQVSTPHSLGILTPSESPSQVKFQPIWATTHLAPLLQFHRETRSPFLINPYPYFDSSATNVNFCVFRHTKPTFDPFTRKFYANMFDRQLDAVYSAMKSIGFGDVDIVVAETGWPTVAEPFQTWVNLDTAHTYNSRLVEHVNDGLGTPLMPGRKFETYIFGLFTENLKDGPVAERNFGLFRPDFSPVYDIGVMKGPQVRNKWFLISFGCVRT